MNRTQLAVKDWAKRLLDSGLVVLDTETTGLRNEDEIVQLSIVSQDGRVLVDEFVRPTRAAIGRGAYKVHGIDQETVNVALPFLDQWEAVKAAIGDLYVVAYNARFDQRMLMQTVAAAGNRPVQREIMRWKWRDAMDKYADYYGMYSDNGSGGAMWQSLEKACQQQGITHPAPHKAVGDALATVQLVRKLAGWPLLEFEHESA